MRPWIFGAAITALIGCGPAPSKDSDSSTNGGASSSSATSSTTSSGGASSSGGGSGGSDTSVSSSAGPGTGGSGAATTSSASTGGASGGSGGQGGLGPELCPGLPAGAQVGTDIGDQLPDITVKSCDGTDYSLKELCGAQGLWIFAAHGWCPLCQSVSNNAEFIHDGYAGQTLASVHIIVADAQNNPPDGPYCDLWRSQHGHEDVVTLYDPTGTILQLWPGGSSSLSAFVDENRVITGKLVHTSDITQIKAGIDQALVN